MKKYNKSNVIVPIEEPESINLIEKKERGIVICATGHEYYGMMALRLALSIHISDHKMPITLITEGEAYNWAVKKYSWLFDQVLIAPKDYLYVGDTRTDIKLKTFADIISPYNETMLIDADTLWLGRKKPQELFDKFQNHELFFPCLVTPEITDPDIDAKCFAPFARPSDIKEAYQFSQGTYYDLSAEFLYFKKTESVKTFFEEARKEFENPMVTINKFAGATYNEQVAFTVALLKLGMSYEDALFKPTYWTGWQGHKKIYNFVELSELFFILSVGGSRSQHHIRREYESLAKAYLGKARITDVSATLEDKFNYLPQRRND